MIYNKDDVSGIKNAADRYLYSGYDCDFSEDYENFSDTECTDAHSKKILHIEILGGFCK